MSKLDKKDIKKIAHLARLGIPESKIVDYATDLTNILDLIEQMNQVDTNNVEPLAHPLDLTQRLRTDEVTEPNQRETFQKIAPATEAGLYLVPKVIE